VAQRFEQRPADDDEEDCRSQLARFPRLSNGEERRLLATQGPDRDKANRVLIEHNLHLVLEAAQARKDRGVPFGDLFQEGTVGLISAVEHHKPGDAAFHARLVHAIAATMDDVVAQTEDAQRNDESFVVACRLLESAQRLLSERLGRAAAAPELARLLQWEEARVQVILGMLGEARVVHDQELLDYLNVIDDLNDLDNQEA
jgi:DNA-directed RNA polymerase sigma subunit (sigma70/sigma32)